VTINDKHLEKHEQQTGDKPLAGAQITKSEDSAVKQRQELIDGLKSHRITKDGNAFTIDMGDGETIQDVRAGKKPAASAEQQHKPLEVPSGPYNDDYAIGPRGRAPNQNDSAIGPDGKLPWNNDHSIGPDGKGPWSNDSAIGPDGKLPWNNDHSIGPDGKGPWSNDSAIGPDGKAPISPGKIPEAILPGEGDYMPTPRPDLYPIPVDGRIEPRPHDGWESVPPGDLSKFTVKTDTSIDKNGHIVTTETRADGSTFATAQAIGADNKLHVVSTELKDVKGNTIVEKFDPTTGQKTEEFKDTGIEKTDTKYNAKGQVESRDTTSGLTGKTDHEVWLRSPLNDNMVIHLKNGIPDSPQSGKLEPSVDKSSEAGERQ
jgi:hypothetical protein